MKNICKYKNNSYGFMVNGPLNKILNKEFKYGEFIKLYKEYVKTNFEKIDKDTPMILNRFKSIKSFVKQYSDYFTKDEIYFYIDDIDLGKVNNYKSFEDFNIKICNDLMK